MHVFSSEFCKVFTVMMQQQLETRYINDSIYKSKYYLPCSTTSELVTEGVLLKMVLVKISQIS